MKRGSEYMLSLFQHLPKNCYFSFLFVFDNQTFETADKFFFWAQIMRLETFYQIAILDSYLYVEHGLNKKSRQYDIFHGFLS